MCSLKGVQCEARVWRECRLKHGGESAAKTGFCAISSGLARRTHLPKSSHTFDLVVFAPPTVTSLINRHDVARLRRKVELPVHSASAQHQRTHTHDPPDIALLPIPKIASLHIQTHAKPQAPARIARRQEETSVDMSFYRLMASRRSCTP